jgi:HPt (histidine-containing phosphotransfer) domain-containing protein
MTIELDLARLSQMGKLLGSEPAEIVEGLLADMSNSMAQIEQSLAAGDLPAAVQAAHRCRNDALMVGAKDFLRALETVEQAGRDGDLPASRDALAGTLATWDAAREELERLIP